MSLPARSCVRIGKLGARRAFTLIELLISVAIISLLIAILAVALGRARAKARLTLCISNIRGQAAILHAYTVDYQGALPPRLIWNYAAVEGSLINEVLAMSAHEPFQPPAYEGSFRRPVGIWRCPEVAIDDERRTHSGFLFHAPNQWLFNYVISYDGETFEVGGDALPGWEDPYAGPGWRQLEQVRRPSEIISLAENTRFYHITHSYFEGRESLGSSREIMTDPNDPTAQQAAHAGLARRPAAFLDGHAESLPSSPTFWLDEMHTYRPIGNPAMSIELHNREVRHFLWYLKPEEAAPTGP